MRTLFVGATVLAIATSRTLAADGLEEIVVTARRQSEALERTPVAVSIVSAEALAERAIVSEQDLRVATPGLGVKLTENANTLNFTLRGQSVDAFSNTRPGVLPYVNEVQTGGGAASAFYDLQSVQVLKGPQGTLFGRNATGGAVLFTTQKPEPEFAGYVSAALGNYAARKYEGAINVPLASTGGGEIRARLAGVYQSRDGFQFNTYDGENVGGFERYGIRGSFSAEFGALENQLVVEYSDYDGENTGSVISGILPSGTLPVGFLYAGPADGSISDATWTALALAGGAPPGTNLAGAWAAFTATHPGADPEGLAHLLAVQQARSPHTISANGDNFLRSKGTFASNVSTYDIDDSTQIKSVLGYTRLTTDTASDLDGTPYTIHAVHHDRASEAYSAELQLLGKILRERLSYIAGLYYSDETFDNRSASTILGLEPFVPPAVQVNSYELGNKTYAAYAQGVYDLAPLTGIDGLGATLGLRYTSEQAEIEIKPDDLGYAAALLDPSQRIRQDKTTKNTSWTAGLQYQVNPALLLYGATRRSFKNGGYNGFVAPFVGLSDVAGNGYGQETITDVELGAKYRGNIASMPVRVNFAAYQDWIKDNQRVAFTIAHGAPAAVSINVPKAEVYGVELETQISPTRWLDLGAVVNYMHGEFTDNLARVQGIPTVFGTYPDSPKWSGDLFGEITAPLGATLEGILRADVFYQDDVYTLSTANLNPGGSIRSFAITNFRLGIQDTKRGWSVSANLKNAFNKEYFAGGVAPGELFGYNWSVPGDPRTLLVEARMKF